MDGIGTDHRRCSPRCRTNEGFLARMCIRAHEVSVYRPSPPPPHSNPRRLSFVRLACSVSLPFDLAASILSGLGVVQFIILFINSNWHFLSQSHLITDVGWLDFSIFFFSFSSLVFVYLGGGEKWGGGEAKGFMDELCWLVLLSLSIHCVERRVHSSYLPLRPGPLSTTRSRNLKGNQAVRILVM